MTPILPGLLTSSAASAISDVIEQADRTKKAVDRLNSYETEVLPVLITEVAGSPPKYAWKLRMKDANGLRIDHPNGRKGTTSQNPAFDPNNLVRTLPFEGWIRRFGWVQELDGAVFEIINADNTTVGATIVSGEALPGVFYNGNTATVLWQPSQTFGPGLWQFSPNMATETVGPIGAGTRLFANVLLSPNNPSVFLYGFGIPGNQSSYLFLLVDGAFIIQQTNYRLEVSPTWTVVALVPFQIQIRSVPTNPMTAWTTGFITYTKLP
jgi:hypothetical protein